MNKLIVNGDEITSDINKTIKAVEVNGKNYINPPIYNNNGSYYFLFYGRTKSSGCY